MEVAGGRAQTSSSVVALRKSEEPGRDTWFIDVVGTAAWIRRRWQPAGAAVGAGDRSANFLFLSLSSSFVAYLQEVGRCSRRRWMRYCKEYNSVESFV